MKTHDEATDPLPVSGTGVLLDGSNFYLVPSQSEEGRSHVVTQHPTRLSCDCKGFFYRQRCVHVAAVVAHKARLQLEVADTTDTRGEEQDTEREPEQETRWGITAAGREALAAAKPTASAMRAGGHPGDTALMRRSNRPFSLLA